MANSASRNRSPPTEEQFFKRICSNSLRKIEFPAKFFSEYLEGNNTNELVTLKSPLLTEPCKVKRVGEELIDGWSEFCKLHELKLGDYVHFTHEGNFVFYVTTFSGNGNRILYADKKSFQVNTKAGTIPREKRNLVYDTHHAGRSRRSVSNVRNAIKECGNSGTARKKMKKEDKTKKHNATPSVENDCFLQNVTQSNFKRNSFYISKKFSSDNCFEKKRMNYLGLLNSDGNTWGASLTLCSDERFKVMGGWKWFCEDNNLQIGDYCKFKIQPHPEEIRIQLVHVFKDVKETVGRMALHTCQMKEEQCELEEEFDPFNDAETVTPNMKKALNNFAGKPSFEKGQCSRK